MEGIPKLSLVMGVVQASFEKVVGPVAIYSIMMVVFAVGAHVLFGDDLHFNCCPEDYSVEECREAALAKEDPNMEVCASTKLARKWEGYECSAEGYKCMEGAAPMYDQFTFVPSTTHGSSLSGVYFWWRAGEPPVDAGRCRPAGTGVVRHVRGDFQSDYHQHVPRIGMLDDAGGDTEIEPKADAGGDSVGLRVRAIHGHPEGGRKGHRRVRLALAPKKSAKKWRRRKRRAQQRPRMSGQRWNTRCWTRPAPQRYCFPHLRVLSCDGDDDVVEPFDGESTKTFKEKWWNETN